MAETKLYPIDILIEFEEDELQRLLDGEEFNWEYCINRDQKKVVKAYVTLRRRNEEDDP